MFFKGGIDKQIESICIFPCGRNIRLLFRRLPTHKGIANGIIGALRSRCRCFGFRSLERFARVKQRQQSGSWIDLSLLYILIVFGL